MNRKFRYSKGMYPHYKLGQSHHNQTTAGFRTEQSPFSFSFSAGSSYSGRGSDSSLSGSDNVSKQKKEKDEYERRRRELGDFSISMHRDLDR